jgi:NADP-dependent 3-hydroxy acid dehydrogenase YdfG
MMDKRTALITGASSGIGRAIAKKLAQNGIRVSLVARHEDELQDLKKEIEKEGGTAMVCLGDVTKPNEMEKVATATYNAWHRIDILVNDAGIMPLSYLKNLHLDEQLKMVDINFKGVLITTNSVLPYMINQKSGHIVNISSIDSKELYKGGAVYGATKAAVNAYSAAARMELSPEYNIRVTSIQPGTVDTPLRESITDQELLQNVGFSEDEPKLKAEDIANAVFYAVSQPEHVNVHEIVVKPTGKA